MRKGRHDGLQPAAFHIALDRGVNHEPASSLILFLMLDVYASVVLRTFVSCAIALGIFWLYRGVQRASAALGYLLAAGLILRCALGAGFFWLAFLDAPFLRSLRNADGAWRFALDGVGYMRDASSAAQISTLAFTGPDSFAPGYVQWLAAWMSLTGVSVASAVLLNVSVFVATCAMLTQAWQPRGGWREDLPCLVLVASLSLSPALLLHDSQPLKDELCAALLVVACLGTRAMLAPRPGGSGISRSQALGGAIVWAAVYLLSGLRAWTTGLVGLSLGLVLLASWVSQPRPRSRIVWTLAGALAIVASVVFLVRTGIADRNLSDRVETVVAQLPDATARLLGEPDRVRRGFVLAGGDTSLADGPTSSGDALSASWTDRARALGVGVAATFAPALVLQATGVTSMSTSSSLLIVSDVDTIFTDVSILLSLVLLSRRRVAAHWHARFVVFVLVLGCITMLLMAYTVTNLGTLFRLRVMSAIPFWMLGLAFSRAALPRVRQLTPGELQARGHRLRVSSASVHLE